MQKNEIAHMVASRVDNVTVSKAAEVIDAFFEVLVDIINSGTNYNQKNFGTFKKVRRAARKGRNPQTKEIVNIPETNSMKIVLSQKLKERLNQD